MFTVKDSGKRINYASGMRRDVDDDKPRYDLTIPLTMKNNLWKRLAIHMMKGMKKYGYRNWELANSKDEYIRFKASAFRHFIQWFEGELDEDHAAAVFFNIQCAEYVKEKLDENSK
jgi:hypothetical protein